MNNKIAIILSFFSIIFAAASARAVTMTSLYVTFTGGDGDYLTITFSSTITLTTTSTPSNSGLSIVLDGAGNLYSNSGVTATGTVTVDSTDYTSFYESSGYEKYDVTADDLYMYVSTGLLASGSTITISGSYTTTSTVSSSAPTSGYYDLYITDGQGNAISFTAVVVPEPSEYAGFAGIFVLGSVMLFRRRACR